jgi:hypothetical protein
MQNETYDQVKEILHKTREKQARRVVTDQLASYHDAFMARLSSDNGAFVQRITERLREDIEQREPTPSLSH